MESSRWVPDLERVKAAIGKRQGALAAIQKLKEEPGCFQSMVAEDPELAVVTLLQSAFLCASHAAFLPRLSLLPGLFLSLGLYDSAKTGL